MKSRVAFGFLLVGILAYGTIANAEKAADQQQNEVTTAADLRERIKGIMSDNDVPGMAVAVVRGDEVILVDGFGVADRTSGKEVGPNTLFRGASISKTMVALAALKAQEQGKLELAQPFSDIVSDVELTRQHPDAAPVRIEHLLEHTAGLDDIGGTELWDVARRAQAPPLEFREVLLSSEKRYTRWAPGSYFAYNNLGPSLAAYAIENATEVQFETFVDRHIFEPLGMEGAGWGHHPDAAQGYLADGLTPVEDTSFRTRPSGALHASASDFAALLRMLVNDGTFEGEQVVSAASLARMRRPSTLAANLVTGYGLGTQIRSHRGFLFYGHGGATAGFMSIYEYTPGVGGYAVFINSAQRDVAHEQLPEILRDFVIGEREPQEAGQADLSADQFDDFTGGYQPAVSRHSQFLWYDQLLGVRIIERQADQLHLRGLLGGEPTTLIPTSEREFRTPGSPVAEMVFTESGMLIDTTQPYTSAYEPIALWWAWLRLSLAVLGLVLMLSALVFALIWGPRKLLGKLKGEPVMTRGLSALAAFLFVAFVVSDFAVHPLDVRVRYTVNAWSIVAMLLSLGFGLASLLAFAWCVRDRLTRDADAEQTLSAKLVYWHSMLVSSAALALTIYFFIHGYIVFRPWTI